MWASACGLPQMLGTAGWGSRKQTKTEVRLQEAYYGVAEETSRLMDPYEVMKVGLD